MMETVPAYTAAPLGPPPPAALPPSYQDAPQTQRRTSSSTVVLANPEAQFTTHSFEFVDAKNKPWGSLKVRSRANAPAKLPIFFDGDDIAGTLDIDLAKPEKIHSITVQDRSNSASSDTASSNAPFLLFEKVLWNSSMGKPRNVAEVGAGDESPVTGPFQGKLEGKYSWSYKFNLPSTVEVPVGRGDQKETHPLPPHFSESSVQAVCIYDISCSIRRGVMKMETSIKRQMGILPSRVPPPPSLLRQIAYQEQSPLCGPEIDPEGWETLEPVRFEGTLFNVQSFTMTCRLSLAKPLVYTRGSILPMRLTLASENKQALDLLGTSGAPQVALLRVIHAGRKAQTKTKMKTTRQSHSRVEGMAIAFPARESSPNEYTKWLDLELPLRPNLQPGFVFQDLVIKYNVVLLPFQTAGFVPSSKELLQTHPVDIVVKTSPSSPRAISYAPAGLKEPPKASYPGWEEIERFSVISGFG
ncbi:hypothetical protein SISSUDRAFT_234732 [Sistotremastrum suecicum HHB10207 ss-3]|uniref:Arrestin-like N-terminal domain-containing protein n=1 Tax=Sistotremastrum suecicum HHB10207 ss-3 TaxID=1314776 RepID=A0A166GHY7_9AGAM|nr:hypothetical protein SISSUDRAFT_234732 [Sistotremastrum suecicum HHB10207 ss-3]